MPDALALALGTPGLVWLIVATFVAGAIYGFAGFGAALVFMPVAVIFVKAELAVAALAIGSAAAWVTVVPKAWPRSDQRFVLALCISAFLAMPFGVYILRSADPVLLRGVISVLVLLTLAAMLAGWRYRTAPRRSVVYAIGAGAGLMGASTGLPGPLVILFNLGVGRPAEVTRASTLVFLTATSLMILPQLAFQGALTAEALWLGVILFIPYGLGNLLGAVLFNPEQERMYRAAAYIIIGVAGVLGLPFFS